MRLPPELRCPVHAIRLAGADDGDVEAAAELRCAQGCAFPIWAGIPRFVSSAGYAGGFGLQWKAYARTQLDSHTGATISRDRLQRCLGGSLDAVRGRGVLEVGCGAGRFTEVLLAAGARVFACDLSDAVEANHANCARDEGYFVCQADVSGLPCAPLAFEVVLALGMVQHTPDPERTIAALARHVAPDGLLVIDHYAPLPSAVLRALARLMPRELLRRLFLRMPPEQALRASAALTRALLPIHRALWRPGGSARALRSVWRRLSPVADHYDRLPSLPAALRDDWALLDTHDWLTDRYKHLRDPEQVAGALRAAGLSVEQSIRAGNGVEARARRTAAPAARAAS